MDSIRPANPSNLSGKLRSFTKLLRLRSSGVGVSLDENIHKAKLQEKLELERSGLLKDDEEFQNRMAVEALLARVFASLSSVKAAYAQMQISQSPYDAEGIQLADDVVVSELKRLSELKQSYLKKQSDPNPEETLLLADIQEMRNLAKTYEIIGKKIESELKLKESEISCLREKAEECDKQNRLLEKRLNRNGNLSVFDELHLSCLNPNHFNTVLKHTIKSIRGFVKLLINGMESSGWDIDSAANSIEPGVFYTKTNHKCFAFESFVCQVMLDNFQYPNFSLSSPEGNKLREHFYDQFTKLKSAKIKPRNPLFPLFLKFCRAKYLRLIHSKMELSLFGDLDQRNTVKTGGFPETSFFEMFSEMARRVWLLHCLAFSFQPEAAIFQVRKGSRFSELYMESVTEDAFFSPGNPLVSLTVVPGFKIGKTIIQSQVYLSPS